MINNGQPDVDLTHAFVNRQFYLNIFTEISISYHAAILIVNLLGQSGIPWLLQAERMFDYQDIYEWNSKCQKTVFPMVFITLQSIGENEYGKTGHSKILTFLKHFMIILKYNFFFRASILHHMTDTDNT